MQTIHICDYIGNSNREGPIGHPIQVVNDAYRFFEGQSLFESRLSVPRTYRNLVPKASLELHYSYDVTNKSFCYKFSSFFRRLKNLSLALKSVRKNEAIWFVNCDIVLFLYLAFLKPRRKKIIVTLYRDNFGKTGLKQKLKSYIFQKGLKRVDFIFKTSRALSFQKPSCFIPDYCYRQEDYPKPILKKSDLTVCLGTMNEGKDLRGLVDRYNASGDRLLIHGYFYDKRLFADLTKIAKDNITIKDNYCGREEYLDLLNRAKYCILPYTSTEYDGRTSGVLLDAVFLNTTVIGPKNLLIFNGINGVGYDNISEIQLGDKYFDNSELKSSYSFSTVKETVLNSLAFFFAKQ